MEEQGEKRRGGPGPGRRLIEGGTDMKALIAAVLMLGATSAGAVTVESATGDWSGIPELKSARESLSGPVVGWP